MSDSHIIINTISNRCRYMMLIHSYIAAVACPIRFNRPVRALLGSVICGFPWILCSLIAIFCSIGFGSFQHTVTVRFQILCRMRKYI